MFKITVKEPDKAYLGNFLWIPKTVVTDTEIKERLSFAVPAYQNQPPRTYALWTECLYHWRVPRHFQIELPVPIIDLRHYEYQYVPFEDYITLRDAVQQEVWEHLSRHQSDGILHLGCGMGKTVLSLKKVAQKQQPFLVVVLNTTTIPQWISAIRTFLNYDGPIGLIQGQKIDFDAPVVIASIFTLYKQVRLPVKLRRKFGIVIFDEVHHTGAEQLRTVLPMFWGQRLGLTATIERSDGLEGIVYAHMGGLIYSDERSPLNKPKIYFISTPTKTNLVAHSINKYISIPKIISSISKNIPRNEIILHEIQKAQESGRKILALVHNVRHAKQLANKIQNSVAVTGSVNRNKRLEMCKNSQVVIATYNIATEGIDLPELDTLMLLTPFKFWGRMRQALGRIQRAHPDKKEPIVVIFYDVHIPPFAAMCKSLMKALKERGYTWEVVNSYNPTIQR